VSDEIPEKANLPGMREVPDDDTILRTQLEYYRRRAPEYDEWFLRQGRYDRGEEHRRRWFAEVASVREALAEAGPAGAILELACGTGLWTELLVREATSLLAVDGSEAMLKINEERVADTRIHYLKADLFDWQPDRVFDFIFFGFWLSHVPRSKLDSFWQLVSNALTPAGKVFFIDSAFTQESTARDHDAVGRGGRVTRKLNDGRQFEIVKEFYAPRELERDLRKRGWSGYVRATGEFFIYGSLTRQPS
jgi:demethylmenaquinone methyltransferase/2-methoxy-6-polyprenyl-1,4-benzoquinol methylase